MVCWRPAQRRRWPNRFFKTGTVPARDDERQPRRADDQTPALAVAIPLGAVEPNVPRTAAVMLGYDDIYAIDYMGEWLRSYWKTKESGKTFGLLLLKHHLGRATFDSYCAFFDRQLATVLEAGRGCEIRPPGRAGPPAIAGRQQSSSPIPAACPSGSPRRTPAMAASAPST